MGWRWGLWSSSLANHAVGQEVSSKLDTKSASDAASITEPKPKYSRLRPRVWLQKPTPKYSSNWNRFECTAVVRIFILSANPLRLFIWTGKTGHKCSVLKFFISFKLCTPLLYHTIVSWPCYPTITRQVAPVVLWMPLHIQVFLYLSNCSSRCKV